MDRVIAHYRLLERLGGGGGGEVYKAEDTRLGRVVALKLLAAGAAALDEARAAASLDHPNVATVYDVGESDGRRFVAFEYVEGLTVAERIARGRLGIDEAVDIALHVAHALEAAHAAGLVHCDVTASNVAVAADGRVKVLDFGLARRAAAEAAASGTPGYVAPEQLLGIAPDARADLFSLGVVLYEMIAGEKPFPSEPWPRAMLDAEPAPLSASRDDVPLALERVVRRALEKSRESRYASAAELAADLRRLREQTAYAEPRDRDERAAFRGLLPFQEGDRDRFFGRDLETAALVERIAHTDFRFGVLYGDSGSGKTSLLRAAVIPELWDAGLVPVYVRSHTGPEEAVAAACRKASGVARDEAEPLDVYLERVARALEATLVVVLDQFEEFFVGFRTAAEREPFLSAVAACSATQTLPAKFLVSIRSDFLHLIGSELAGRIPEPLASARLVHLRTFDETRAAEVVERSVRRAGVPFEAELSHEIARDLAVDGAVLPSELQIVGERLQARRIFTREGYRRAGGKEVLVYDFLEDVIRASGDRDLARLALRALVSEENTRATLTLDELASRTQRGRGAVGRVVKTLVEARIVRELQEDDPWRYELVHEYLVERINRVTGGVLDARQRANRLLRQYMAGYGVDARTRIPLGKLWFIKRYTDIVPDARGRELVRKSLRSGLVRAVVAAALISTLAILAAAALSIEETWDGALLRDGHTAAVRRAVFAPDGRLLFSAGEDGRVIVWDFARRDPIATLEGSGGWLTALDASPDGRLVAVGGSGGNIDVWNATTFDRVTTIAGSGAPVVGLAFSPDSRLLAACTTSERDGTVLYETATWSTSRHISHQAASYENLVFTADGRRLLSSRGSTWDVATGERVEYRETDEWIGNWIALSRDDSRRINITIDGEVYFWDYPRRTIVAGRRVHHDHGRAVAISPDGRLAASGAEDVVLWDARTGEKLTRFEYSAAVWSVTFSPDGRWLVATYGDGAILVWDAVERERVANLEEHAGPVRAVAFSPDGTRIATASEDRSVILWNASTRRKEAVFTGHATHVLGVAFAPDGTWLASGDQDDTIFIWDVATHSVRASWPALGAHFACYAVAVSPDGRTVAGSHGARESASGRLAARFVVPEVLGEQSFYGLVFSKDGRLCYGVIPKGYIVVFETDSWRIVRRFADPAATQFVTLALSPDQTLLATGDDNGKIRLWNAETLEPLGVVGRHAARVKSVAFSPDGAEIASAGDDRVVALWSVRGRTLVGRVGTHTVPVLAVAYSPDGRRLVTGEHDGSVRLYTRHRSVWGYSFD